MSDVLSLVDVGSLPMVGAVPNFPLAREVADFAVAGAVLTFPPAGEVQDLPPVDEADEDGGWQERALCAQTDPEAFFPEKGGSTREAKKVCLGCDVRGECLEYALANDERFGIWGGLSERERRRLKKSAV